MASSVKTLAKELTQNNKDKDLIKTQFASADISAYFQFFKDELEVLDRGIRVKTRDASTDTLWGLGTWGTDSWDDAFDNDLVTVRVVHPNRTYIDNLNDDFFKDTSNTTATW